jgi:RNA polymerase sigma-70 factor (ECF subfamily)
MDALKSLRHRLLKRLIRHGTSYHDAEDAIQQAFERLCRAQKAKPIHDPAAFLTDLLAKVRIDRWRAERPHREALVAEPLEDLELIDLAPNPEECAEACQRLEYLETCFNELNARTRQIYLLHRVNGLSYSQIAAALELSVSAIEKHIARAALLIHELLDSE